MNDNIIVLTTNDGEELEFIRIADIALDGNVYVILKPVELMNGMDEDEAIVFMSKDDQYTVVLDEELLDNVFEEYYRLLD